MAITAADVKKLREMTGLGMMDCKQALSEAGGDTEKAVELLRKKGLKTAEKRLGRATANGIVASYMHHTGRVGVLLQINCETDFVARNEELKAFAIECCKHICAFRPLAVSRDELDPEVVAKERALQMEQLNEQHANKPENIREQILEGSMNKWYAERVLMEQPWIHDDKQTADSMLKALIGKIGENIRIVRFARLDVDDVPAAEEEAEAAAE